LLRQGREKVFREQSLFQIVATLLLAIPLSIASIPVTLLAALLRQGTAVTLYAQKPLPGSARTGPQKLFCPVMILSFGDSRDGHADIYNLP